MALPESLRPVRKIKNSQVEIILDVSVRRFPDIKSQQSNESTGGMPPRTKEGGDGNRDMGQASWTTLKIAHRKTGGSSMAVAPSADASCSIRWSSRGKPSKPDHHGANPQDPDHTCWPRGGRMSSSVFRQFLNGADRPEHCFGTDILCGRAAGLPASTARELRHA